MKFDDQLAAYLYEHKTLRLEGLGTFTLDSKVSVPNQQEKEIYYPIEGLSFTYNPKSDSEENLIFFLVKKLHKIQPLIRSDLESYLSNIKQFINLGKPYTIEGVGTLSKNNQGIYEFTPGNFLPVKEELNPKRENAEHNYPVRSQSSAGRVLVIILIVIAALAALGGIGWGVSNFLTNKQTANENQQADVIDTTAQPVADSLSSNKEVVTSRKPTASNPVALPKDTTAALPAETTATKGDSARYKMIFEITKLRQRANRRTLQLHSLHSYTQYDSVGTGDSVKYRLFLPVKIRTADIRRVKDSLHVFFGGRIIAEKQ